MGGLAPFPSGSLRKKIQKVKFPDANRRHAN